MTGCGSAVPTAPGATSATTTSTMEAVLAVSLEPVSVVAGADPTMPFTAKWNVVIRETAGVGGTVNFINSMLRDGDSGAAARPTGTITLGPADIVALVGTAHIPARGSLTLPESLQYALPSGGAHATVTVAVQFLDDLGHVVTATAELDLAGVT